MKVLVFLALTAFCCGQDTEPIAILKYENDGPNPDGSYRYSYETGNGISAEEEGHLKNAGSEETEALEVRGSYKYTAPDGTLVSVTYIANENGFQPQGTHISAAGIARNPQETRQRAETPAQPQTTSEQPETAQTSGEEAAAAVNGEVASEAEASLFRPVYRARAQFRRF